MAEDAFRADVLEVAKRLVVASVTSSRAMANLAAARATGDEARVGLATAMERDARQELEQVKDLAHRGGYLRLLRG